MHQGHRKRMKDRFIKEGLDGFDDHQVLELLLFYCIPRKDTNELAHKLIEKFGSLSGVFEADPADIEGTAGIGFNSAVMLNLIPSLSRRYFKDRWGGRPVLSKPEEAGEYAVTLFAGRVYEVFYAICLDSKNGVIFPALVHEGTINEARIYPRIVVETALRHKAATVLLAHNHPGGTMKPSAADINITRSISNALNTIQIKVLDHIIVAGEQYYSMSVNNLMGG